MMTEGGGRESLLSFNCRTVLGSEQPVLFTTVRPSLTATILQGGGMLGYTTLPWYFSSPASDQLLDDITIYLSIRHLLRWYRLRAAPFWRYRYRRLLAGGKQTLRENVSILERSRT